MAPCLIHFGILTLTVFCGVASGELCPEYGGLNTTYHSCDNGCCYSYIYPCCDDYFYQSSAFKVSIGVAVACFFISCACVAMRWKLREQRARAVIRTRNAAPISTVYGNPANPTTTAPFSGYNTNYGADFGPQHPESAPPYAPASAPPAYSTLPPSYHECAGPDSKTGSY